LPQSCTYKVLQQNIPKSKVEMRKIVFLTAFMALSGSAFAGDEEAAVLAGGKLKQAVSGKTVYLMTPIGVEIPVRYRPDGTIHGTTSASLAALGGESVTSDTGRWWVVREQLCQQWKTWADSRSHCYKFRANGENVTWQRNDGKSGTARIASK
jgi:hypothetical protein